MSTRLGSMELAQMIEFAEAAAYVEMFRAAPSTFYLWSEETDDGVALFAPELDMLLFNRVIGMGLTKPVSRAAVDSFVHRYRQSGVKNFGIQLAPDLITDSLTKSLEGCGLYLRDYWTKVYRSVGGDVSMKTDLTIEEIDRSHAGVFGQVACAGFGMPASLEPLMSATVGKDGWHHYISYDGAVPAGAGALFVRDRVGWLGIGATLPSHRRRGGQGAMMARRLSDGADLGCDWFVTETGRDRPDKPNPSFHNMLRTGFDVAYHRPNFMPPKQ